MERTWFFTVFSARNRDEAISPLVWPSAISDMISDSRADSDLPPCPPARTPSPGTSCTTSLTSTRPMRPPLTRPVGNRPWSFVQSHCSVTLTLIGTDSPNRHRSNRAEPYVDTASTCAPPRYSLGSVGSGVGQPVDRLGQRVERGDRCGQCPLLPGGQRRQGQVQHGGVRRLPGQDRK